MDDPSPPPEEPARPSRFGPILGLIVTAALLAATAIYQGYHAYLAFDPNDTNHLETMLILVTARQVATGPSTLYGPFSGENPLVLIHAPLYYRLATLGAWPLVRWGVDPFAAAIISGRFLSFLGLVGTCLAAARVARVDGASASAGLWAALLVASSPIFGSYGFTVRADTLAVAAQTAGFALTLSALRRGRRASFALLIASGVLFAMSACLKQHLIVAGGVAALLLIVSAARGRVRWAPVIVGLGAGALATAAYYGWEEWITGGMMSRSVFGVSRRLRETAYAGWGQVGRVYLRSAGRSVGEVALAAALLLAGIRKTRGTFVDAALAIAFVADTAAMIPLCINSTGSWLNYAMPSVVWASILLARGSAALLRGDRAGGPWIIAIPAAALVVLAADLRYTAITALMQKDEAQMLGQVLADPLVARTPRDRRYFADMPQGNRLYGRPSLAYDSWLYRQYEKMGLIEPKDEWLLRVLGDHRGPDSISVLVVASEAGLFDERQDGLPAHPPELGFRLYQQYGRYAVWVRTPEGP